MSIENIIKTAKGHFVSPVRRIESVYPVKEVRTVGLILCCGGEETHEDRMNVLSVLKQQDVSATLCITGSVAENDDVFVKEALGMGCQLINGGFSGRPYSARKLEAPSSVVQLPNYAAVNQDVAVLHETVLKRYDYKMTAGMPPYGVESISNNLSVYDVYDEMDYLHYKGSFHAGQGEDQKLLSAMDGNPDALNGQIVVLGISSCGILPDWFDRLAENDYAVCSVETLLDLSPFTDIGPDDPCFDDAVKLMKAGYPVVCRNNRIYPKACEIFGDTSMLLCGKDVRGERVNRVLNGKTMLGRYSVANVYSAPIWWARNNSMRVKFDFPTTSALLGRILLVAGYDVRFPKLKLQYTRREIIKILADALCATDSYDPYGVLQEKDTDFEAELRKEYGDEVFEELKAEVKANRAAREAEEAANEGKKEKKELSVSDVFGIRSRKSEKKEESETETEPVKRKDDQIEL